MRKIRGGRELWEHGRVLKLVAVAAAAGALMLPAGTGSAAPALVPAAKNCKKGQALLVSGKKQRCVRRCPKTHVRKKVRRRVMCVKRKPPATQTPGTTTPGTTTPGTTTPGGTTTPPADPGYTPPADPVAEFTRLMAGSYLYYLYHSTPSSTGASTYREDKVRICADGTWTRHREDAGVSGTIYPSDAQGTWKVNRAAFARQQLQDGSFVFRGEAEVALTSTDPEDPATAIMNIADRDPDFTDATAFYIGNNEHQRTAGGAGC